MKIKFNPNLGFQREAIDSIVDIFRGQETYQSNFTVAPLQQSSQMQLDFEEKQNELGTGNRLKLLEEDVLENVRDIQLRNGLRPSDKLNSMDFTVEMETGTGKTYVYLRTIFELSRQYGFTKFIIVVPSVAIKEGVYKSLQITEEHFKGIYANTQYDYFIYDSQKLGQVRSFATNDYIQIMVINIDAFRKSFQDPEKQSKANIIHRPHDRMTGLRPIEFIQQTNPIVIIDEPQSVDTTPKSREAISTLNPLCKLRYSATHVDKYNMMYKLDSVDAYERKLVKQIEVASIQTQDSHNKAYIKLIKIDNRKSPIIANIEIDVRQKNAGVKREKKTVRSGDDLLELSGGRGIYDGYIIDDICCEQGKEYIDFTSKPDTVWLNQTVGDVNDDEYKRLQIRKTIEEHLEKEMDLRPKGIKVLSLFFIDRVANYRWYDEEGSQQGKYAKMFEQEYKRAIHKPKYQTLFEGADLETAASGVHNGYFAVDKKGCWEDIKETVSSQNSQKASEAYNLIMRDKEKLLSFDTKLKFIFSHSALREGWDNPNIFQICTLNETASVIKKRQEVGRGLRIAVNQNGERVHGFDVNRLTIMANESYEEFARQLQKEIEQEEGIKFGIVEKHLFANIPVRTEGHKVEYLGVDKSEQVWEDLKAKNYIDSKGQIQDLLRTDLKNNEVDLPEEVKGCASQVTTVLRKVAGNLNIKNADNRKKVKLNKTVYGNDDFKQLWGRIKYKTTFRVDFDSEKLIKKCVSEIKNKLVIGKARFVYTKATTSISRGGIETKKIKEGTYVYNAKNYQLPDIITYLQNETNLTRRTLVKIIKDSERLQDFKNNPQKYIEQVAAIIKHQMRLFIVDGIRYHKISNDYYYAQELFEENELYGYLNKNMLESKKSVYDHVVYDSDVEKEFAGSFELNEDIKVYAKLPAWFKIDTPLGSYNPDWAVLVEVNGERKLYFVVETKATLFPDDLRPPEQAKIDCGKKHFKALGTEIDFTTANNYASFAEKFSK